MKITKQQLILEGILQGIKDNWGKGLLAIGGVYAANKGLLGSDAQKAIQAGGSITKNFVDKAGDWSKDAVADAKDYFEKTNSSLAAKSPDQVHQSNLEHSSDETLSNNKLQDAFKDATKDIKISDSTIEQPDTLGDGLDG